MGRKHDHSLFTGLDRFFKSPTGEPDSEWTTASEDVPLVGIIGWSAERDHDEIGRRDLQRSLELEDLVSENLQPWLQRGRDAFHAYESEPPPGARDPIIRLLICHQNGYKHAMSRDDFAHAEEVLDLPVHTLPTLMNRWGLHTSMYELNDKPGREGKTLDITLKTSDIPHLTQCGIALTYDFERKTTTAFLRGVNGVIRDNHMVQTPFSLKDRFTSSLKFTKQLWRHPLLLPIIVIYHENAAVRNFSRDYLMTEVTEVSRYLSAGTYSEMANLLGGKSEDSSADEKRTHYTTAVNNLMRVAIEMRRGLKTTQNKITFLQGVHEDLLGEKTDRLKLYGPVPKVEEKIKGYLKLFEESSKGLEAGIDAIVTRLEVQLNLVQSTKGKSQLGIVASQLDNTRGSEMAAQAGLDSVAMVTLAVVTAVFLPGTFVATVFSMSMFDWQAGQGDAVVSGHFWVFWAVSVPLTCVVLFLWWLWWNVSRVFYAGRFSVAARSDSSRIEAFTKLLGKAKMLDGSQEPLSEIEKGPSASTASASLG